MWYKPMGYRGETGCTAALSSTMFPATGAGTVVLEPAAAARGIGTERIRGASQGSTVAARLRAADQQAAEDLFNAAYPRLAGWVRRLVDDDETAHEIASEAFVRLLSKWTSPDKLDNPQSYLFMIATNLVRDHWRKAERERRAMRNVTAGSDPEPSTNPAQDVDVRELIAALPVKLRDPFLLHYYAGFGVKEIAALVKRPEGTVKADLYHARARLKEALAEREGNGEPGDGRRKGGRDNAR